MVTTVVSETKAEMRAKIIKQYIKIASEFLVLHTHYNVHTVYVHTYVVLYTLYVNSILFASVCVCVCMCVCLGVFRCV